jgi:hypothetical protein
VELDGPPICGGGAARLLGTAAAASTEAGAAGVGDVDRLPGGAGHGPGAEVDVEVVECVAALHSSPKRRRFDDGGHLVLLEVVAQFAGAIGRVAEHFGALGFAVE